MIHLYYPLAPHHLCTFRYLLVLTPFDDHSVSLPLTIYRNTARLRFGYDRGAKTVKIRLRLEQSGEDWLRLNDGGGVCYHRKSPRAMGTATAVRDEAGRPVDLMARDREAEAVWY